MDKNDNKIIAYKGFDKDLKCRGFQYEVGKEYELPEGVEPELCEQGFHACDSPLDVLYYYFLDGNAELARFCEVEQSGIVKKGDDGCKNVSSKIKIKAELKFSDFIKLGIEWIKEKTSQKNVNDYNLNDKGEKKAKIGSSGDYAKIGSSGYSAKIGSSGYSAKIGSSGYSAKIGSSGYSAQIGSSGYYAQIGSSGYYAQIGSSGDSVQIGSSGYYAQIGSSGDSAKIGSSGDYAQIGSSGYYAQIGSSGYSAKIGSSGDSVQIGSSGYYAQIGSSGYYAKIGSSGDYAKIGSSGDSAKIGSSGDYAKINSTGNDSVIMCAGNGSIAKAKKGSWITLAEWYMDETDNHWKPKCVKTEYVDGERIKGNTWYRLKDGEFKEVTE